MCSDKMIIVSNVLKYSFVSGRGYLNQGLAEDERGRSRLEYYPEEEQRFTTERARSQLSVASRINGPGALSYK